MISSKTQHRRKLFALGGVAFDLYSKITCQRILKNADFRGGKRKDDKEQGNYTENGNGDFLRFAGGCFIVKLPCFKEIRNCGRNKENNNIDPIRRLADHAVVGVKQNRDQDKTKQDSP